METKEAILATINELSNEHFSAESSDFYHSERSEESQKNNRDSSPTAQNDKVGARNDKVGANDKPREFAESSKDYAENALDSANLEKKSANFAESSNIFIDIKEEVESLDEGDLDDEVALLLRMKEKSLVLFEGLKSAQSSDESEVLKMKLEMVISYLEYQLFVVSERLENLKGERK